MSRMLRIVLETLTCGGKAESSEDDVYAVVAGANTASGPFNAIFPDSGSEWIMDDHGEKRELNVNSVLYYGALPEGSETKLTITLRERDGSIHCEGLAGSKDSKDGGRILAAAIAEAFPNDTDDRLGTFSLSAQNSRGNVDLRWAPVERSIFRPRDDERKFQETLFSSPWSPLCTLPTSLKTMLLAKALARYGSTPNDPPQVVMCTGDDSYYWAYVRAEVVDG